MDTKNAQRLILIAGVMVVAVVLGSVVPLPAEAVRWMDHLRPSVAEPAQSAPTALREVCAGSVKLDRVLPGEYPGLLPTPDPTAETPPDLGDIDLGLQLSKDGNTVSGYVDLETTLVFTAEHTVDSVAFGPSVQGTFDGTRLRLTSERVSVTESSGRPLQREFMMTGGPMPDRANVLTGEYRETVWGFGPQVLTIVGRFTLACPAEPVSILAASFHASPRAGPAPLRVQFEDLSTGAPTAWSWSFGDGASSTEQHPTHTYTAVGRYTVALTVSSAGSSDTMTSPDLIVVGNEALPVAHFTARPLSGDVPLHVTFTDLSAGGPTGWQWSFGDSATSTLQNPMHTYTQPGKYTVTLEVRNAQGSHASTAPDYITVTRSDPPTADFRAWPTSGNTPLAVVFADRSTNQPTAWRWNFGDGGTSTVQNPTHTYTQPGMYDVSLTVTNNAGSETETKASYISVTRLIIPPTAAFDAAPRSGTAPLTVRFTDQSTGGPTSWSWDFGDGGTSTAQHPTHTFQRSGSLTITLTVRNDAGSDTLTKPDYVTASETHEIRIYLPSMNK